MLDVMGKLEQKVQKSIRKTRINKAIISTLAISGVLAVGLLAPNVIGALGKMGLFNLARQKQSVKKSLTRLIECGYVRIEKGAVHLTQKGETLAALLGEGRLAPRKTKRWDGKWRILIFDIPERRKKSRESVRNMLLGLGFRRLQDSVWVYPYDCEDLITVLKIDLHLGNSLVYIIADSIENDNSLRKLFSITKLS